MSNHTWGGGRTHKNERLRAILSHKSLLHCFFFWDDPSVFPSITSSPLNLPHPLASIFPTCAGERGTQSPQPIKHVLGFNPSSSSSSCSWMATKSPKFFCSFCSALLSPFSSPSPHSVVLIPLWFGPQRRIVGVLGDGTQTIRMQKKKKKETLYLLTAELCAAEKWKKKEGERAGEGSL